MVIIAPDNACIAPISLILWCLYCNITAPFTVKTALEGTNVFVQAASFDSPLVHSKHAVVNAGNEIKVGAMYTSSFSAHADGPIHIGFMQGFAKVCMCHHL